MVTSSDVTRLREMANVVGVIRAFTLLCTIFLSFLPHGTHMGVMRVVRVVVLLACACAVLSMVLINRAINKTQYNINMYVIR
jgi:hypothetical protein